MPNYTQSYDRNNGKPKFFNTIAGAEGYNPTIKYYYSSDNHVVRVEETWRDEIWYRTISGSNYAQNWPNYTYYELFSEWTTVS